MKRIFISDLHLDKKEPRLREAFEIFLAGECRDADQLYILGDLFEAWIGDDDSGKHSTDVINLLSGLSCELFLMHGNRDFLIGDRFCEATRATLLQDPSLISIGDENVLLMHGDSLCTLDTGYQHVRQVLRSEAFQSDFLKKTISEREHITQQMRGQSKKHTSTMKEEIMDVTPEEVVRTMNEKKATKLIHGHTHRPAVHEHQLENVIGHRYVLGDWRPSTRYLSVEGSDFQLKEFNF